MSTPRPGAGPVGPAPEGTPGAPGREVDDVPGRVGATRRVDRSAGSTPAGTPPGEPPGKVKDRAGDVAAQARQQAAEVAGQTRQEVRDLAAETREQVVRSVREQQHRAADGARGLARGLSDMADRAPADAGAAPEVTRRAAHRLQDVAGYLEEHEPGDLLEEVESFARNRPGLFLAGAAVAGFVTGRMVRGAVSGPHDGGRERFERDRSAAMESDVDVTRTAW